MENFDALKHIEWKIERDAAYLVASLFDVALGMVIPSDMVIGKFQAGVFLSGFMVMTGATFFVLLFLDVVVSTNHFHDWHKAQISAYRLQQGLPLPKHEKQNIEATQPQVNESVEPKQPLNVIHETKDAQGRIASWKIDNHPDRPSEDFIRYVFLSKTDAGLIPTERALQDEGKKTNQWNTAQVKRWLEIFDQLEITKKVYESERGNSPRCLNRELTINQIREKFGYAEVKP